ncbi:hypothetical protein [Planctomycetes bacterium K23_9]|uniref:Uncharacterized protein n=1 Tax=Stieleria marina TaxID=1930275 RepID=A0A517NW34_9BACT|nr:hypothetical protein K239x_33010 [Planctomycetes bacterium K23_9]
MSEKKGLTEISDGELRQLLVAIGEAIAEKTLKQKYVTQRLSIHARTLQKWIARSTAGEPVPISATKRNECSDELLLLAKKLNVPVVDSLVVLAGEQLTRDMQSSPVCDSSGPHVDPSSPFFSSRTSFEMCQQAHSRMAEISAHVASLSSSEHRELGLGDVDTKKALQACFREQPTDYFRPWYGADAFGTPEQLAIASHEAVSAAARIRGLRLTVAVPSVSALSTALFGWMTERFGLNLLEILHTDATVPTVQLLNSSNPPDLALIACLTMLLNASSNALNYVFAMPVHDIQQAIAVAGLSDTQRKQQRENPDSFDFPSKSPLPVVYLNRATGFVSYLDFLQSDFVQKHNLRCTPEAAPSTKAFFERLHKAKLGDVFGIAIWNPALLNNQQQLVTIEETRTGHLLGLFAHRDLWKRSGSPALEGDKPSIADDFMKVFWYSLCFMRFSVVATSYTQSLVPKKSSIKRTMSAAMGLREDQMK